MSEDANPRPEESPSTTAVLPHRLDVMSIFVGTLLCPVQTFRKLAEDCRYDVHHLPAAFALVILVFALDALRLTPPNHLYMALFNVPSEVICGLMLWGLSALVVSLTGLCFGAEMYKVRACFVTMAWSLLPWIFLSPIACFWKLLGPAHVLFMTIPMIWIFFLQLVAIKQSFHMKIWQVLVLAMVVPSVLSWYQLMQFLETLAATIGSFI